MTEEEIKNENVEINVTINEKTCIGDGNQTNHYSCSTEGQEFHLNII